MSRAELELDAQALEPGQSVRMACPFCGGGPDRAKTLSLTHAEDGTLLYHCYRAGCGAGGRLGKGGLVRTRQPTPRPSRIKPSIEDRLREVQGVGVVWGMGAFTLNEMGVRWDDETQRFALPMFGPTGLLRGRVLRVPPGDSRWPKVLTLPYMDVPVLAWNRARGEQVIVVEDIPSSLVLEIHGYRAVALNGTHMTEEAIEELDQHATDVVWALDRDAVAKAMRLNASTRMYFGQTAVLVLERDVKDMDYEEVRQCLASGISWLRSSAAVTPTTE